MSLETPIALADTQSIRLARGSFGSERARFDSARLMNTYRLPIRIREIAFTVYGTLDPAWTGLAAQGYLNLGGLLKTTLSTAGRVITNAPTPLWNLAAPLCSDFRLNDTASSEVVDGTDKFSRAAFYRWILPHPLDLAPGQGISAEVEADKTMGMASIMNVFGTPLEFIDAKITVSALGHFHASSLPATRQVPYASPFIFAPTGPQISDPRALGNPFAVPLEVQRLTGRHQRLADNGFMMALDASIYAWSINSPKITMRAPNGYAMVRDPTPFFQVFNVHRHGWDVRSVLPTNSDYFQIQMVEALPADAFALNNSNAERLTTALIGSRLERF